jgi:hypothetical protein
VPHPHASDQLSQSPFVEASECIAVEVNGEQIRLYDVLRLAKLSGKLRGFVEAIDAALIRQEATQRGYGLSDEELQQAADGGIPHRQ